MTAKAMRNGYVADVVRAKTIRFTRPNPTEPAQVVICWGDHTCTIVPMSDEQVRLGARDLVDLAFSPSVKA